MSAVCLIGAALTAALTAAAMLLASVSAVQWMRARS